MIIISGKISPVRTAYRCRVYPSPEQATVLNRNGALDVRELAG